MPRTRIKQNVANDESHNHIILVHVVINSYGVQVLGHLYTAHQCCPWEVACSIRITVSLYHICSIFAVKFVLFSYSFAFLSFSIVFYFFVLVSYRFPLLFFLVLVVINWPPSNLTYCLHSAGGGQQPVCDW